METKMSVLFYLRKAKTSKESRVPIYLRVTIDGKRFDLSTDRFIDPDRWSSKAGKAKGTSEEFKSINAHLEIIKMRAFDYRQEIFAKRHPAHDRKLQIPLEGGEKITIASCNPVSFSHKYRLNSL